MGNIPFLVKTADLPTHIISCATNIVKFILPAFQSGGAGDIALYPARKIALLF
jgi:hypothetical protein